MKFRPRFTVRTLAIVVTLVCAYFATWEATKRYGAVFHAERSPLPFFVIRDVAIELPTPPVDPRPSRYVPNYQRVQRYYLWFFGGEIQLFETPTTDRW